MSDRPYVTNPGVTNPRKIHSALFIVLHSIYSTNYQRKKSKILLKSTLLKKSSKLYKKLTGLLSLYSSSL